MNGTLSFGGRHAVLLARPDGSTGRLTRRLQVLGLRVIAQWMPLDCVATPADLILVDADAGWDGLLPRRSAIPPVPLVALLASEAPGRIAWALDQGATAVLGKPVAPASIHPALARGARLHAGRAAERGRGAASEERLRLRPLVAAAVRILMQRTGGCEAEAYRALQREAMDRRLALEQVAAEIAAGPHRWPEAG